MHYGPYLEGGIIKHRTNRLVNLVRYLEKKGNTVELIPSIYYDTLEVVTGIRVAFRCRITFLSQLNYEVFGKSQDPIFMKAIEAIDETLGRIGHVGPNIKVPGVYKGMFNISQDFGSGIVHNNYPKMVEELGVDQEDDESLTSVDEKHPRKHKKSIKFTHY